MEYLVGTGVPDPGEIVLKLYPQACFPTKIIFSKMKVTS